MEEQRHVDSLEEWTQAVQEDLERAAAAVFAERGTRGPHKVKAELWVTLDGSGEIAERWYREHDGRGWIGYGSATVGAASAGTAWPRVRRSA